MKILANIEYAIAGRVDWWNNRRLHGTLGMVAPVEQENAHNAALKTEKQPVRGRQITRHASLSRF